MSLAYPSAQASCWLEGRRRVRGLTMTVARPREESAEDDAADEEDEVEVEEGGGEMTSRSSSSSPLLWSSLSRPSSSLLHAPLPLPLEDEEDREAHEWPLLDVDASHSLSDMRDVRVVDAADTAEGGPRGGGGDVSDTERLFLRAPPPLTRVKGGSLRRHEG